MTQDSEVSRLRERIAILEEALGELDFHAFVHGATKAARKDALNRWYASYGQAVYDSAGARASQGVPVTLDVALLSAAMDTVWPSHSEGTGGTGDTPNTSWEVMDPTVPHPNLVKAIAAEYERLASPPAATSTEAE